MINYVFQYHIDAAIASLDNGVYAPKVAKELKHAFNKLVLEGKISKEGLAFFTEINKPNFDVDLATSSTTWF